MKQKDIKREQTFLLIKPDGVGRGLIGEIISRIEKRGLKIVALKMIQPTKKQIDNHYPKQEAWIKRVGEKTLSTYQRYGFDPMKELGTDDKLKIGLMVRGWLIDFMISGPVVKMVVEGIHAIEMVRKLAGDTIPAFAEMGTIRGDFSVDSAASANRDKRAIFNLIHASETPQEANHEINHWFGPEEIFEYIRQEDEIAYPSKS